MTVSGQGADMGGRRGMTPDELWELARWGGDDQWYEATGACGGCGEESCHQGACDGDVCTFCVNHAAPEGRVSA